MKSEHINSKLRFDVEHDDAKSFFANLPHPRIYFAYNVPRSPGRVLNAFSVPGSFDNGAVFVGVDHNQNPVGYVFVKEHNDSIRSKQTTC